MDTETLNTILHFITGGGLAALLTTFGIIKAKQKRNGGTMRTRLERIEQNLKVIKGDIGQLKTDVAVLKSEINNIKDINCGKWAIGPKGKKG